MTHHDDARFDDLVAQLGDGDSKDLFRLLLERGMQQLIDSELTATIGALRSSCTTTVRPLSRVNFSYSMSMSGMSAARAGPQTTARASASRPVGRNRCIGCLLNYCKKSKSSRSMLNPPRD